MYGNRHSGAGGAQQLPTTSMAYDMHNAVFYKQDDQNVIYPLTSAQLPVLQNLALLDIRLSRGHSVEAHWHPNAAELVYAIRGETYVGVLNAFTNQVTTYCIRPPQVVYIPQGWWHWEIAATDDTHLLAVFDNSEPQTVFGSDVLTRTPKEVFQAIYCINPQELAQALRPIRNTVVIGPPHP